MQPGSKARLELLAAAALFSTGGFWAWFGLGDTPATPIGWIIVAGLASGAVWYGVTRYLRSREQGRVLVIHQKLFEISDLF